MRSAWQGGLGSAREGSGEDAVQGHNLPCEYAELLVLFTNTTLTRLWGTNRAQNLPTGHYDTNRSKQQWGGSHEETKRIMARTH